MALRIGTLIDRLGKADAAIKIANAELEKKKATRTKAEKEIFARFKKQDIDGATGKLYSVTLRKSKNASLSNWQKLAAYVYRTKSLDLFQRRISKQAWEDRLATRKGKPIPGITMYQVVKISLHKKR